MRRTAPEVMFIGSVLLACIYSLLVDWTVGPSGTYVFIAVLVFLGALVAVIVRLVLALRPPRRTETAFVVGLSVPPILLGLTVLMLAGTFPDRVRFGLSKDALTAYASTVTATECDSSTFEKRRVGLYTITCASRYGDRSEMVDLEIEDRWTSEDWHIGGRPGDWVFELRD